MSETSNTRKKVKIVCYLLQKYRSLDLPERLELPERSVSGSGTRLLDNEARDPAPDP